jgi:hypothetical protein
VIIASLAGVFYGGRLIERMYFRRANAAYEGDGGVWRALLARRRLLCGDRRRSAIGVCAERLLLRAAECGVGQLLTGGLRHERRDSRSLCGARRAGVASAARHGCWPKAAWLARLDAYWVLAACGAMACAAYLAERVAHGETARMVLARPLPNVDLAFHHRSAGRDDGGGAERAWRAACCACGWRMRAPSRRRRLRGLLAFIALAMAGVMAVAFSANLFSFFVAYQALALAAFPLVAHRGDEEARTGGARLLGDTAGQRRSACCCRR